MTADSIFAKPKFTGGRFTNHRLPVIVAGDLAAYQALLIDLAKHLYLQDHPERKRCPKGFADISLDITNVESGSTVLSLALAPALLTGQLYLQDNYTSSHRYFEGARDIIAQCIESGLESLPDNFPPEALGYFNQLGRSLEEGESLELKTKEGRSAILTNQKRKQLVLKANKVYEQDVELSGYIEELDASKPSLRMRTDENLSINVPISPEFISQARESVGNEHNCLFIKATAQYNSRDELQKVIKCYSFEIIKNNYFVISFEKLSHLPDGWFEGAGKAPNITDLQNIAEIFIDQYPEKMPFPSIVPTQDGNILLEWESDNMPSVDIIISSKMAFFHAFGQDGGDIEDEFQLDTYENIQKFFNFLSQYI